jgi:hypothetical protein
MMWYFTAYLDDLDEAVPMCNNPRCPRCQGKLLLTASCHRGHGLHVQLCASCGSVHLSCGACRRGLFAIAVEQPACLTRTCRHRGAVSVEYADGQLVLSCARCESPAGTLAVAAYTNLRDV